METYQSKQVKNSTEPMIVFDICYKKNKKKKLVGNMVLYLVAALNSPSTFNAGLKKNPQLGFLTVAFSVHFHRYVASCGIKRVYHRAFFYFPLFKILPITGTRCFSFAALPCSAFQCSIREAEMGSCVRHG